MKLRNLIKGWHNFSMTSTVNVLISAPLFLFVINSEIPRRKALGSCPLFAFATFSISLSVRSPLLLEILILL